MTGTLHETIYPERGHRMVAEFYGDLDYRPDGSLAVSEPSRWGSNARFAACLDKRYGKLDTEGLPAGTRVDVVMPVPR